MPLREPWDGSGVRGRESGCQHNAAGPLRSDAGGRGLERGPLEPADAFRLTVFVTEHPCRATARVSRHVRVEDRTRSTIRRLPSRPRRDDDAAGRWDHGHDELHKCRLRLFQRRICLLSLVPPRGTNGVAPQRRRQSPAFLLSGDDACLFPPRAANDGAISAPRRISEKMRGPWSVCDIDVVVFAKADTLGRSPSGNLQRPVTSNKPGQDSHSRPSRYNPVDDD